MGFLKSPEIPLEGLIKIPLEGNFFRFPREEEKTQTRAVEFLKSPEIPLEDDVFHNMATCVVRFGHETRYG